DARRYAKRRRVRIDARNSGSEDAALFGSLRSGEADAGPFANIPRHAAEQRARAAFAERIGGAAEAGECGHRAGRVALIAGRELRSADRDMHTIRHRRRCADEIATRTARATG